MIGPCPPPAPSSASPPPSRSARWRSSASSPTTRARRVGTLLSVRFVLAAALFWALVAVQRRRAPSARARPPRRLHGPRARRRRLQRAGRRVLRRAATGSTPRCSRCCSTRSRRWSRSRRSRSAASAPAARVGGRARARVGAASCSCWPGRPRGARSRSARLLGLSAAVIYTTYILTSAGVAGRVDPLVLSALVCTGAATTLTLGRGRARRPAPGGAERGGLRLAGRHRGRLDRRRRQPVLRRPAARRARPPPSILSTAEPVTTVVLAYLAFGESLGPAQLAGGSARPRRGARPRDGPPPARATRRAGARPCGGARRRRRARASRAVGRRRRRSAGSRARGSGRPSARRPRRWTA